MQTSNMLRKQDNQKRLRKAKNSTWIHLHVNTQDSLPVPHFFKKKNKKQNWNGLA